MMIRGGSKEEVIKYLENLPDEVDHREYKMRSF